MTRKTSPKSPKGKTGAARHGVSNDERIIAAALLLAADEGWRNVTLLAIAARAKLSLAEVHGAYSSKSAILDGFFHDIDHKTLAAGPLDASDSMRDRLFEVLMRRFDALAPHKDALRAILRDGLTDSLPALCAGPCIMRSMAWMLEAAGQSAAGLKGVFKVGGLTMVYINAFRAWLNDDASDMAKTMAALDKGLARAESLVGICRRVERQAGEEEAAAV